MFINFSNINVYIRKSNCLVLRQKTNLNSITTNKKKKSYNFFFSKIGNTHRSHENRIQSFNFFNLAFSFLGVCETIYLTVNKLNGSLSMCSNQTCTIVLDSVFSNVIGIPMSFFGTLLYGLIFYYYYSNVFESGLNKKYRKLIQFVILVLQFILCFFSLYFSAILKLFLQSNCPWCAFSMLISVLLLFFGSISKNGNKIVNLSRVIFFIGGGFFIAYCLFFLNILELLIDVL